MVNPQRKLIDDVDFEADSPYDEFDFDSNDESGYPDDVQMDVIS